MKTAGSVVILLSVLFSGLLCSARTSPKNKTGHAHKGKKAHGKHGEVLQAGASFSSTPVEAWVFLFKGAKKRQPPNTDKVCEGIICPPLITEIEEKDEECRYRASGSSKPKVNCCPDESLFTKIDDAPSTESRYYSYNFKHNLAKAKRDSKNYPDVEGTCSLLSSCKSGYECTDRNFIGRGKCALSTFAKFHGEECGSSDQCNLATADVVNMVCTTFSKRPKCLLKEEAYLLTQRAGVEEKECACGRFAFGKCDDVEECDGNVCAQVGGIGSRKWRCKATEASSATCSNCRKDQKACK